jgi:hypothetical protein
MPVCEAIDHLLTVVPVSFIDHTHDIHLCLGFHPFGVLIQSELFITDTTYTSLSWMDQLCCNHGEPSQSLCFPAFASLH